MPRKVKFKRFEGKFSRIRKLVGPMDKAKRKRIKDDSKVLSLWFERMVTP